MKLKTTKGKQFVTGFGVLRIQLNNFFFLNVPLHPQTSQCLISILQLLSCQTQTCINTLCASACILFTYRVKPAGELGDKQFCFVNRIKPLVPIFSSLLSDFPGDRGGQTSMTHSLCSICSHICTRTHIQ